VIGAQHVIDIALDAAARLGGADETMVLVGDRVAASLRWANNSMTTNGASRARNTTVISIVRQGDTARVGTLTSAEVDPSAIEELVAAS
jgi:predicted Zn-dependent protease